MARLIQFVLAVAVFLYLSMQLLSFNLARKEKLRAPERFIVWVASPGQKWMKGLFDSGSDLIRHYAALTRTSRENDRLIGERARLLSELTRMGELERENDRLRALLDLGKTRQLDLLGAELVARGASPYERTIRISRGRKDGVSIGMAVLHPKGVVGQVIEVLADRSDVLLLTDQTSYMDVVDQRSRVRGILRGSKYDELRFEYVPKTEDLQAGDEVVTSGLDGVYPAGIPVGTVTSVNPGTTQMFLSATVKPSVEASRLEEVAVVKGPGEKGDR